MRTHRTGLVERLPLSLLTFVLAFAWLRSDSWSHYPWISSDHPLLPTPWIWVAISLLLDFSPCCSSSCLADTRHLQVQILRPIEWAWMGFRPSPFSCRSHSSGWAGPAAITQLQDLTTRTAAVESGAGARAPRPSALRRPLADNIHPLSSFRLFSRLLLQCITCSRGIFQMCARRMPWSS